MEKITVKFLPWAKLPTEEKEQFKVWASAQKDLNCFDNSILTYPHLSVAVASDGDGPFFFVPLQVAFLYESIATRPGAVGPLKEALALRRIEFMVDDIARKAGLREQYFICKDNRVSDICARRGFEEMTGYRTLRRRTPQAGIKL